jgi:hypothetical protein
VSETDISIKCHALIKDTTINEFLPYIRRNKYFKSQFDAFGIKFEGKPNQTNFRVCFPVDLVARILIFRVRMLPETFITPQPSSYNKSEYSEGHMNSIFRQFGFNDIIEDLHKRLVLDTTVYSKNLQVLLCEKCEKFIKKLSRVLGVNKNINSIHKKFRDGSTICDSINAFLGDLLTDGAMKIPNERATKVIMNACTYRSKLSNQKFRKFFGFN